MKITDKNTNTMSAERIWIHKTFASMWFNNNDQKTEHTIDKTIKFLEDAKKQSSKEGYVEVVVRPEYDDGDSDNLPNNYIQVVGFRLETDEEYKRRLASILWAVKRDRDNFDIRKKYYDTDCHTKRVGELENAMEEIRSKGKK